MTNLAYFDNAATTFPKPEEVYSYADSFYRTCGGNAGRGNNTLAAAAAAISRSAKDNLKKMYSCEAKKVVFTASATEALNRILLGLSLKAGDTVYVTPFEHNAVTRPLAHLVASAGINLEILAFNRESLLPEYEEITKQFSKCRPALVVMTHASNVCGAVIPVLELAKQAKSFGATVVVDMSQTCGLLELSLNTPDIDFAVFAGHKTLYGPFGVGGFICCHDARLNPVLFGGNGINSEDQEMPREIVQMSEVGSQNVYAIAGLKASTDWLLNQGLCSIKERESVALGNLLELLRRYNDIEIVADKMKCDRIGVVSAKFAGYSPDEVELLLGRMGIAVRSGLHCAPFAHRFLGTLPSGTVRFSVSILSTDDDFNALDDALFQIEEG